ncbi:MAG TPA: DNRLRE domain-containing protein [Syntrophomonadaceae bacterium]|nr:DNRLRE domain-containing protein [Syntrophomonadaceae bacterium]
MAVSELFPIQSAYVSQFYANQSFIRPPNLFFGQYHGAGDIYRSLIQFPLHSIPISRIINSAQLTLPISRNEIPVGTVINAGLQYALVPWSQSSVTWNNQPGFNLAKTFSVSSANIPGSVISIDITSLVISWINGSIANDGFVITGNEQLNSLLGIANTELVTTPFPIPLEHCHMRHQHFEHEHDDHCKHHHRKHRHNHHEHHRELDREFDRDCDREFDREARRLDVIGTSIAVQNPPGSLNFVVVPTIPSVGPKLIINFS